jgi:nitrous oxide reductase accessory protein NosL
MRLLTLPLLILTLGFGPAAAVETESDNHTCAYCGGPWDTSTRVQAVFRVDGLSSLMRFDSAWHALQHKWRQQKGGHSVDLVLLAGLDYSAWERGESLWLIDEPVFIVLTDQAIPGGQQAPYVAMFATKSAAEQFRKKHGGDVMGAVELEERLWARFKEENGG